MYRRSLFLLLPLLALLTACGPEVVYQEVRPLAATGWTYADSLSFVYPVIDRSRVYDLVVDVTHSEDFAYQNFYVWLHTTFPNGKRSSEKLSLQLAGDYGAWLGDCSGGSCTLGIPILQQLRYTLTGDYVLTIAQHSRDEPLVGIERIGVRLVVNENK